MVDVGNRRVSCRVQLQFLELHFVLEQVQPRAALPCGSSWKKRIDFFALVDRAMLKVSAASPGGGTCSAGDSLNPLRNLTAGGG